MNGRSGVCGGRDVGVAPTSLKAMGWITVKINGELGVRPPGNERPP